MIFTSTHGRQKAAIVPDRRLLFAFPQANYIQASMYPSYWAGIRTLSQRPVSHDDIGRDDDSVRSDDHQPYPMYYP